GDGPTNAAEREHAAANIAQAAATRRYEIGIIKDLELRDVIRAGRFRPGELQGEARQHRRPQLCYGSHDCLYRSPFAGQFSIEGGTAETGGKSTDWKVGETRSAEARNRLEVPGSYPFWARPAGTCP